MKAALFCLLNPDPVTTEREFLTKLQLYAIIYPGNGPCPCLPFNGVPFVETLPFPVSHLPVAFAVRLFRLLEQPIMVFPDTWQLGQSPKRQCNLLCRSGPLWIRQRA